MPTREPNRRGEGELLRDQLVDAAAQLLVAPRETEPPSLRAIARACGVAPSAVYTRFGSQDDLIHAVIARQYDDLRTALRAADVPTASASDRLIAMARAYVGWGLEHPGAYQLLFERPDVVPDRAGDEPVGPGLDLLTGVEQLLRLAGVSRLKERRGVARLLWSALHGIVSLRLHKQEAPWVTSALADADAVVAALTPGA